VVITQRFDCAESKSRNNNNCTTLLHFFEPTDLTYSWTSQSRRAKESDDDDKYNNVVNSIMLRSSSNAIFNTLHSAIPAPYVPQLNRDLVQLSCVESKQLATPYNENADGHLLSGMYVLTVCCLHDLFLLVLHDSRNKCS
jgi:hypothetical protein